MAASSSQMAPSSPELSTRWPCVGFPTRVKIFGRGWGRGSWLENHFIGPANLFLPLRLVCCAQVPESGDESSRVTLANHCAIPAIYEDREFCQGRWAESRSFMWRRIEEITRGVVRRLTRAPSKRPRLRRSPSKRPAVLCWDNRPRPRRARETRSPLSGCLPVLTPNPIARRQDSERFRSIPRT